MMFIFTSVIQLSASRITYTYTYFHVMKVIKQYQTHPYRLMQYKNDYSFNIKYTLSIYESFAEYNLHAIVLLSRRRIVHTAYAKCPCMFIHKLC